MQNRIPPYANAENVAYDMRERSTPRTLLTIGAHTLNQRTSLAIHCLGVLRGKIEFEATEIRADYVKIAVKHTHEDEEIEVEVGMTYCRVMGRSGQTDLIETVHTALKSAGLTE